MKHRYITAFVSVYKLKENVLYIDIAHSVLVSLVCNYRICINKLDTIRILLSMQGVSYSVNISPTLY